MKAFSYTIFFCLLSFFVSCSSQYNTQRMSYLRVKNKVQTADVHSKLQKQKTTIPLVEAKQGELLIAPFSPPDISFPPIPSLLPSIDEGSKPTPRVAIRKALSKEKIDFKSNLPSE